MKHVTGVCNNPLIALSFRIHSILLFVLLFFICMYAVQICSSSFSGFSQNLVSPSCCSMLSAHICDNFQFLSTSKCSSHPSTHSGQLVLFITCCPIASSEFCSAFVLVWIIPCGLLPSSLYYQTSLKAILGVWGRAPLLSFCGRKLIVRRSNCRNNNQSPHQGRKKWPV